MVTWCEAWSEELKEAELRRYRAECRLRCLTSSLDRIDLAEFDGLMAQIEQARAEVQKAGAEKIRLLLGEG